MYKIRKAEKLADKIYLMDVEAPRVAKHCEPGQFVIVKLDEKGERIPLTICDYDRKEGTITIVFQTVGASTEKFAALKEGDSFQDFTGPLGNDVFQFSPMPWVTYTHISHTNSGKKDNATPLFDWGKFYERDGKLWLPFSVQAHHSFVDGLHIGKLVEKLQAELNLSAD